MTPKDMGQLRDLRKCLGDFNHQVVEWMLDAVHWQRFCQYVQAEAGLESTPARPQVGFLLKHRYRALNVMRRQLDQSMADADVRFCTRLDQLRYNELKSFLLVHAAGKSDWLAKIHAADTLPDMQRVFNDLVDER